MVFSSNGDVPGPTACSKGCHVAIDFQLLVYTFAVEGFGLLISYYLCSRVKLSYKIDVVDLLNI